jgi:iron complex outermembrane receptor protein
MINIPIKRSVKLLSILALSATALNSVPLMAEERDLALEEIVVTARKVEESSQSVPIAITAISAELRNSTIRDLTDLNGFAPNVIIGEDGGRAGGGGSINIRGINPPRSDDNSFDAPIAVVIDGVFLGSGAGQIIENFDLERIEILRGPQGTLFGKNTVGGVINVIRSRPTGEFGGRFKVTVGEDGQQEFRGVLNTALIEDTLAAKFTYTTMQHDGWLKNITTGDDVPEVDYQNYGITLLWTPNDRFEAIFTAEHFQDDSDLNTLHTNYNVGPGVIAPPTDPNSSDYSGGFLNCTLFPETCRTSLKTPKYATHDKGQTGELDVDAYTLNMRYEINENLTLVSVTGYRDMVEERFTDFDTSSAPFITIDRNNVYDQFSQELRLDGSWDTVTLSSGIYYFENDFTQDWSTGDAFWGTLFGFAVYDPVMYGACLAGAFAPIACDSGLSVIEPSSNVYQILFETQKTESIAVFAQADWRFAEQWILTAGIRWTREEKDFLAGQSYLTNEARQWLRNFPEYADLDNEWTETSPKIGITYEINDTSIVYFSYAEGFHSGGFFGVNQNTRDFERDQYDPEFANSWEAGYKSQHLNNRLRLNLTAFFNDFEDKQEAFVAIDDDTKTVATVFDNASDVEYKGVELELEYVFNEYFRAFFNYGYLDAEYKEFETDINATDNETIIEDATHFTPRRAPESTLGVGGTVTIPLGNGTLEMYAKYSEIGDVETDLLNTPLGKLDSRKDLTASIGYFTENWSVQAYGKNLTDEQNELFFPIATLFGAGTLANRPRAYAVEFSYEF